MSSKLLQELVKYDEFRILKQNLDEKKIVEQTKITEDIELLSCGSDDEVEIPEDILTEAIHEKEIPIHDTFLYHINEISIDTNTVTNKIAEHIIQKEKRDAGEDNDVADQEHFLFKDEEKETLLEELETTDFFQDFEETGRASTIKDEKPKMAEDKSNTFVNKLTRKNKKKKITADKKEKATVVAPGENQKFSDSVKYQEEKCFPTLFPTGKGGYASTYLDTGLGLANYIKLRLTGGLSLEDCDMHEKIQKIETDSCIDSERFRRDHHYLMFLLLIADNINIRRAQDTAFRKVTRLKDYTSDKKKVTEQDRALLERRNIGYRTFKNIRGTAPYFEHAKSRLFAFLRQKGPPTIFTTLSSAEFDWMV